jgi:D-beta-D-heptose 7-phosphate kinase/D-beta-D-heptose 1-phosphate adenosyltransferase
LIGYEKNMSAKKLSASRARQILAAAQKTRVLVVGDVMLDQFIWGGVSRISPEAPVPVVDFQRESFMPGGAANVARNLVHLKTPTELFGAIGQDEAAGKLLKLLSEQDIGCAGLVKNPARHTSIKTRIVAQQQQVVRVDRETRGPLDDQTTAKLLVELKAKLAKADAVIVGDYGKGVVTQPLLNEIKNLCRERGVWLSLDPKPVHHLNLTNLSLITPNRKEAFELADLPDDTKNVDPFADKNLLLVAERLLKDLNPALLLITLGELGMLLCQRGQKPFHIPTVAQEVFDVSGAGDTVIASFTLAIAAGASPIEAAILSNHAAGIVVGKRGTATTDPEELVKSFSK